MDNSKDDIERHVRGEIENLNYGIVALSLRPDWMLVEKFHVMGCEIRAEQKGG